MGSKIKLWLIGAFVGILFAVLAISIAPEKVLRLTSKVVDPLLWDILRGSRVMWSGSEITLPSGQYKWLRPTEDHLVIVPRQSDRTFVLALRAGKEGGADLIEVTKKLCSMKANCSDLREDSSDVGGIAIRTLEFTRVDTKKLSAVIAAPKERVTAEIEADTSELLSQARSLTVDVIAQLKAKRPAS